MPRKDGKGPPKSSKGPRDGRGGGKNAPKRTGGEGAGKGGRKGKCPR